MYKRRGGGDCRAVFWLAVDSALIPLNILATCQLINMIRCMAFGRLIPSTWPESILRKRSLKSYRTGPRFGSISIEYYDVIHVSIVVFFRFGSTSSTRFHKNIRATIWCLSVFERCPRTLPAVCYESALVRECDRLTVCMLDACKIQSDIRVTSVFKVDANDVYARNMVRKPPVPAAIPRRVRKKEHVK